MRKLNNEVRILRILEEHHRLFFDKFPSENRHWNASWLQIIFLGANLFRFRETQTSKLRMEDRGKLIPAKFNGIRETFNATKRSNRVRSSSSIIKKDADSDFNDYLLTFFSFFLFQIYIEFTELRNWLYARQTKIAKRTCSKLHEKKRKKKKIENSISFLFNEYPRHLHKDGIDAEQLLEPRAISRKRREKFK